MDNPWLSQYFHERSIHQVTAWKINQIITISPINSLDNILQGIMNNTARPEDVIHLFQMIDSSLINEYSKNSIILWLWGIWFDLGVSRMDGWYLSTSSWTVDQALMYSFSFLAHRCRDILIAAEDRDRWYVDVVSLFESLVESIFSRLDPDHSITRSIGLYQLTAAPQAGTSVH